MKVLVTGATGFLGRHLVQKFKDLKWVVTVISRRKNISPDSRELYVYQGDLASPSPGLQAAFKNQDLVIHAAVDSHSPLRSLEMTKTVIRFCQAERVPKIVFISSQNAGFANPRGYSLAKRQAEELIQNSSLNWSLVRPTVIYDERGGVLLNNMVRPLGNLHFILIPGKGDAKLQPVHAQDVVQVVEKLASLPSGTRVTIGGSQIVSFRQLALEIRKRIPRATLFSLPIPLLKIMGCLHSGIRDKIDELNQVKTMTPSEELALNQIFKGPRRGILQDLSHWHA